jgi:CRISPR-associated endonuclease/helicase Cas3
MEYVAHFKFTNQKLLIQSIKEHTENVQKICNNCYNYLKVSNFMSMVAILHDVGKYSDDFQNYIKTAISETQKGTYDKWIKTVEKNDHGVYGAYYIFSKYGNCTGIQKIVADIMMILICYHHGGLPDCIFGYSVPIIERFKNNCNLNQYNIVMKRFSSENKNSILEKTFKDACQEFEIILDKLKLFGNEKSFILNLIIKLLYSMLIDADRTDTCTFMTGESLNPSQLNKILEKYISRTETKLEEFKKIHLKTELEKTVQYTRNLISEDCLKASGKQIGIYTLTVPTGGGKTLSSLRFALSHAKEHNLKRIIYILPYTTIIEQNAKVVRDVLNCNNELLEYHSNVIEENKSEYNELLSQKWDYPIIFTTMVQYLNTFYARGTQDIRRLHNLCDCIIIFDEIQKVPIKCISLFNSSVNFVNKICNSTAVLCSATQPQLFETKIPIIKQTDCEIVGNVSEYFNNLKRMTVVDKRIAGGYTFEMVSEFISNLAKVNNSILVVANTISTAENIFEKVKMQSDNFRIYLLSTHLCTAHRKMIIEEIKEKLLKNEKIICVSTQLIEAGVDISFHTVIRCLCGLDSISQATGRANRHGESDIKNSYIIELKDEDISKLTEINLGATHCVEVLDEFRKKPETFDNELLSTKAIKRYFDLYYSDAQIEKQMDYPLKNDSESIYEMLELKKSRETNYFECNNEPIPLKINYRFKSASENFRVIDNSTKAIIVPFKEGKNIITSLISNKTLKDKINLLKNSQQYCVNIYQPIFKKLTDENAFIPCDIEGIYLLQDSFYDDVKGVVTDKNLSFISM